MSLSFFSPPLNVVAHTAVLPQLSPSSPARRELGAIAFGPSSENECRLSLPSVYSSVLLFTENEPASRCSSGVDVLGTAGQTGVMTGRTVLHMLFPLGGGGATTAIGRIFSLLFYFFFIGL